VHDIFYSGGGIIQLKKLTVASKFILRGCAPARRPTFFCSEKSRQKRRPAVALFATAFGGLRNNGNYIVKHFPPGNADSSSPLKPTAAAAPLMGKKNRTPLFYTVVFIAAKRHTAVVALRRDDASRASSERPGRAPLLEGVCPETPQTRIARRGGLGPGGNAKRCPHHGNLTQ
jgi:hypothetical protein